MATPKKVKPEVLVAAPEAEQAGAAAGGEPDGEEGGANMTGMEVVRREETALDYRRATDAAGLCREIVVATACDISGRKYVRVEGWQAIAVAHGCVASARDVERIEGGVRAIGEVRRGTDGMVLATAEGYVGDDEEHWGNRPEYAKRAMAQTRAISRACRSAFAHVVVMMKAGLETTPAEEVPAEGFPDKREPIREPQSTQRQTAPQEEGPKRGPVANTFTVQTVCGEVRSKSSESAKGKWTRWYMKGGDGQYYSTFDSKTGEAMEACQGEIASIIYKIEKGPKGDTRTVLSIGPVEADSEEEREAGDDHAGDGMPF